MDKHDVLAAVYEVQNSLCGVATWKETKRIIIQIMNFGIIAFQMLDLASNKPVPIVFSTIYINSRVHF